MNQHIVSILSIVKEEKVYQFMCAPNATFDEVFAILDEFKVDLAEHKKNVEEEAAKRKAEQEAENKPGNGVVEPEIVN